MMSHKTTSIQILSLVLYISFVKANSIEELERLIERINETVHHKNENLHQENLKLEQELHKIQEKYPIVKPIVAFHVSLINDLVLTRDNETAVYDRVITNVGNGYQYGSGRFIATVKGIYLFTATTNSLSNPQLVQMTIAKNGQNVAFQWSRRTGTTRAIIQLDVGDHVQHQRFTGDMNFAYFLRGDDQSSFAGALITAL